MAKRSKKRTSTPRRQRFNRRYLFAALGVIVLAFVGVHIVHGSSSGATKKGAVQLAARTTHCSHARTGHATAPRCPVAKPRRPALSPVQRYARALLPVADRSRRYFDAVNYSTSVASLADLEGVCTRLGGRVNLLTTQAEGVAPSGEWYDAVNRLHRRVANIYHYMQGALVNCATAGENGDGAGAAVAQGDIDSADHQMRSIDDLLHRDARGR